MKLVGWWDKLLAPSSLYTTQTTQCEHGQLSNFSKHVFYCRNTGFV